ncbi:hypothetical protein OJF2_50270 [Aquisphaera giovannonii]|uniref:Uncharacterized protein n=1 Tax=Aquisphaera giovannonii TaxID=406548 RepID=A0A5B9W7D5_9BACT|nr:hypothetical protein [Aquisphaera giovannonii]QEH36463.1 hypothetical protein OJF2_50270 [Aquisphaera giovannonii]
MPDKILALFSSDSRELYMADAYRVLALPPGYSIQLRYRRKHIEGATLARITTLRGRRGIVFFVSGNKPDSGLEMRLTSLRRFEVADVQKDSNIGTFNFYIKLGDFADAAPLHETAAALLPPAAFVSELSVQEGPNNAWLDRVNAVAGFFPNLTFFLINGIYHGQKPVPPFFNADTRASEFHLDEESRYECRMTLHVPEVRPTGISTSNSSTVAQLNVPANHRVGAQNDTAVFEIQTQALQQRELACSTYLWDRCGEVGGKSEPEAWRIELRWRVRRGRAKAVLFGGLMAAAATGVAIAKYAADKIAVTPSSAKDWGLAVVGAVVIGVCAGWLYEFFNKK